ncbi:hypothetical protein BGX31_008929 [Mortierella sp. GBA43]|nr:hypothetical protein BGX31_008929 [Mortierella sp. GBA43]
MRWSTKDDAENIADCLAESFKFEDMGQHIPESGIPDKNEYIEAAILRLLSGRHVVMSEFDIALVEDTKLLQQKDPLTGKSKNPVVAAICMQQMAGYYSHVPITCGTLGAVGSLPAYRNRGLIRRLFLEMMHPVADARGDLMTFILGIPHFYRLFGYEYAVPHKFGRMLKKFATTAPPLPAGDVEPFALRSVTLADLPYLIQMTTPDRLHCHAQLGIYYGHDFWRYIVQELAPNQIDNHHDGHHHAGIIVHVKSGRDVGVSMTSNITGRWVWEVLSLESNYSDDGNDGDVTYRKVMPSILRQLKDFDRPYYECHNAKLNNNILPDESATNLRQRGQFPPLKFSSLCVNLTQYHPVTKLLESRGQLSPENPPIRLYTRVPSLPKWIEKIAPVLEERLKQSEVFCGMSMTLQVDFYRKLEGMSGRGLEVVFRKGRFVSATNWKPKTAEEVMSERHAKKARVLSQSEGKEEEIVYTAGFAPLTFTRLVTGTTDVSELLQRDSENFVGSGEAKLILEVLFPKLDHFVDMFWW